MRALWLVRSNLEHNPGGDTTQVQRTAAALRKRGLEIIVSSDPEPDLRGIDIVHLFHLDRPWENVRWSIRIRAAGVPSVLSSIYWPCSEFDRHGRGGLQGVMSRAVGPQPYQNLRVAQRSILPVLSDRDTSCLNTRMFSFERGVRYVLDTVDAVLPNSRAEQTALERRFGRQLRIFRVHNAVQSEVFSPNLNADDSEHTSVLSVGRIEPRKNQLSLIRALRNTGTRLLVIGQAGRFSRSYFARCRREAGPNVAFLPWISPENLATHFRRSRVHASVSWYETPGLANLEAAVSGCRLVVAPGGATREYFEKDVDYCMPNDVDSIRAAVQRALARPRDLSLSRRLAHTYTWDRSAAETLDAYQHALKRRRSDPLRSWSGTPATEAQRAWLD